MTSTDDYKERLIAALKLGPIRAIGGSVYDAEYRYLFSTSDLVTLKDAVPIRRTDAGGRPTWIAATQVDSEEE